MRKRYITKSASETKKMAEKLAKEILKKKTKKEAFVIGLEGELGSGKTTFLQGFAKGLGIKEKVLSPTFIILKKFQIPRSTLHVSRFTFRWFYHIDCYRIEKPKELLDLGFEKIISDSRNIVAIEWADKIKKILPKNSKRIKFSFKGKNRRAIDIF